jgi:hypothetical protein
VKEQIERKTGLSDGMEEQTMLRERIGTDELRPTRGPTGGVSEPPGSNWELYEELVRTYARGVTTS